MQWSGLDRPIVVSTVTKPEWIEAVIDEPGVVEVTLDEALRLFNPMSESSDVLPACVALQQFADVVAGGRLGEVEALRGVASEAAQLGELLARLDSFGDRPKTERVGQGDDGRDDGRVARVTAQPVDEGLVDLQHVDGEAAEVAERRVAGAEIVDDELDAERASSGRGSPRTSRRRP